MVLKRSLVIAYIIVCLSVLLGGCSSGSNIPTDSTNNITPTPTVEPKKEQEKVQEKVDIESPDFREMKWGMTRDEIIEIEGEPSGEDDSIIAYSDVKVVGLGATLCYKLNNDGAIYGSMYSMNEPHVNKTAYVDDYYSIKEALVEKYGDPLEDETIWEDDLYKDDPSDWGMAVSVGDMSMFSSWETDTTHIYVILSGDNFDISTTIMYLSKEIAPPENDTTSGL